jgi:hypothetical protein
MLVIKMVYATAFSDEGNSDMAAVCTFQMGQKWIDDYSKLYRSYSKTGGVEIDTSSCESSTVSEPRIEGLAIS